MYKYLRITVLLSLFVFLSACQQDSATSEEPALATDSEETTAIQSIESSEKGEIHVLFYGDSITAGYGLELEHAFPARIQSKVNELGWPVRVTNAGLSGETSTGGLNRIDWLLRQSVDIFVLELGGNDGLRGISLDLTARNLQAILDKVKEKNPDALLVVAGMQIPPNLGQEYTNQFKNLFPDLADNNDATLIPFILDGVAGNTALNLPDGIHPTAEGHEIIAETVWTSISPLIDTRINAASDCTSPEQEEVPLESDCEIQHDILE